MGGRFEGVLLATDLDGTLFDNQKKVSAETLAALAFFMREGGRFTLATGRVRQNFFDENPALAVNAPILLGNGALIVERESGEILSSVQIGREGATAAKTIADACPGVAAEFYRDGTGAGSDIACYGVNHITRRHFASYGVDCDKVRIADPADFPAPWVKAIFTGEPRALLRVEEEARRFQEVEFMYSCPVFYEMVGKGANKGDALKRLAALLSVDMRHVYAAGDNLNDLGMLGAAALGFAPNNAHPLALAAADVIVPDNDSHAIAAVVAFLEKRYR